MPRYQFYPRAHHVAINVERAKEAATMRGAKRVQECYPIMPWGVGSNQPRTVAFTCADDPHAIRVANAYGQDLAFVETRERHSHSV